VAGSPQWEASGLFTLDVLETLYTTEYISSVSLAFLETNFSSISKIYYTVWCILSNYTSAKLPELDYQIVCIFSVIGKSMSS